jgi:hypothetical protein
MSHTVSGERTQGVAARLRRVALNPREPREQASFPNEVGTSDTPLDDPTQRPRAMTQVPRPDFITRMPPQVGHKA